MIDVVWKEGCYWTLSNRRLAVFSELERRGFAKQVVDVAVVVVVIGNVGVVLV